MADVDRQVGRSIAFWRDVDRTCRSIAAFSREDADTWRRLFEEHCANRDRMITALNTAPTPGPMTPVERQTLRCWCDERFESDAVKAAFGAWALHVSLSPDEEGSAAMAHGFAMVIQSDGNDVVRGGMQRLPDALAAVLREHGGRIRTGAPVKRILVEDGKAVGVRLADGEAVGCRVAVAANANPARVLLDLLGEEQAGAAIAARMRRYRWGLGGLSIFLALDGPVNYKAGPEAGRATYVHPSPPTLDYYADVLREARHGTLPARPFALCANSGTVDPSRAPAGKSVMKLILLPMPSRIETDGTWVIAGRTWAEAAEPYADIVLETLERDYAPGLRARVIARAVRDPARELELGFDTINGCMTHGAMIPSQSGSRRPIPELGSYRTPVANVYLCGAGTHPGGGVSMMPGRNAAQVICADLTLSP